MSTSTGTPPPATLFGSSGIGGFGYGISVSIGILLIVSTIAFAVYFCVRTSPTPVVAAAIAAGAFPAQAPPRRHRRDREDDVELGGMDESTL